MVHLNAQAIKPLLIFGYGNPSRGDDALGPLLLEKLQASVDLTAVELLTDFQLQIEHALDLQQRSAVLFVDATAAGNAELNLRELHPAQDATFSTHVMSPSAVMAVYQQLYGDTVPPCFLLTIKGEIFSLGAPLSAVAQNNLQAATLLIQQLLHTPSIETWRGLAGV